MSAGPPQTDLRATSTEELVLQLAALHARQGALHEALTRRNACDADAVAAVDATFRRIPEYMEKLRRVQLSMDTLAARTSHMREHCHTLLPDD